jgi:ribonuclease BN (tRNA processing enzyme)
MAPLTLTILGAGPAAPNPGGANSGYLVRQADRAVLLDCGPGTAGQIALHIAPEALGGAAISHFHPDHYFDLVALHYLLKFGPPRSGRLPVWLPPGGRAFLDKFGRLIGKKPAMLEDVFELFEYPLGASIDLAGLEFSFHPVQHYIPAYAMRVRGEDGALLVFSGDAAPCPQLPAAAKDADLFLCESALLETSQDERDPARRGHLTAAEAAAAAAEAGARRLLITHYRSNPEADAHHLRSAREKFNGPVELARPGKTYDVSPRPPEG